MSTLLSRLKTLVIAISVLYALVTVWILVMKMLISENLPIVALFNTFLHLLLIPAFVLALLMILWRRWLVVAALLPAMLYFTVSYGDRFIPHAVAATTPGRTLKILTYNLHAEEFHLDGILNLIRASEADIVNLQELSRPLAERITAELSAVYPYQGLYAKRFADAGMGLLSRYPITEDEYWRNPMPPDGHGQQRAVIDFNGTPIVIYNAHPMRPVMRGISFDDYYRNQDIQVVLKRITQETAPVLLMGDFNITDQTEDYHRITAYFEDTYRQVGWGLGPTYPNAAPATLPDDDIRAQWKVPQLLRLDYIFHSFQFTALNAHVWPTSGGSDHYPVYAELALP